MRLGEETVRVFCRSMGPEHEIQVDWARTPEELPELPEDRDLRWLTEDRRLLRRG